MLENFPSTVSRFNKCNLDEQIGTGAHEGSTGGNFITEGGPFGENFLRRKTKRKQTR